MKETTLQTKLIAKYSEYKQLAVSLDTQELYTERDIVVDVIERIVSALAARYEYFV